MKWLQKVLIGLVAVFTLGIINPTHEIWNNFTEKDSTKAYLPTDDTKQDVLEIAESNEVLVQAPPMEEVFIVRAKELAYEKFGTKIGPVIQEEFDAHIFPEMDKVIREIVHSHEVKGTTQLTISEKPAGNYSEKIFNIVHTEERKDLARFHVRTEKRPKDGFYFNFHYHTVEDKYNKHYPIGEIFYSKNTPPKWLS